jgi:glycosyltransferase involved in cell wall biosynthesis
VSRDVLPFDVRTVAPEATLDDVDRLNVSAQLRAMLDKLEPTHLAIAGYDRPEMRAAIAWANRNQRVCVLMSETKWDDRPRRWWRSLAARYWVDRVDAALVAGAPAGEYLVQLGLPRERIFRHYSAVDNAYFEREAARHRRESVATASVLPEHFFLASCRLIERRKNIKRLLAAHAAYREQVGSSAWELVICGDGEDRAMLESSAGAGVRFEGFAQIDQLAQYYARASCFIHPAMNEAWGLVVNEAMASGLPVLVSRRCGCAYDLVREGENGFTFDPHSVEEITRLMGQVASMTDEQRAQMGKRSQAIIAGFGVERFAAGLWDAIGAGARATATISAIAAQR